MRRVAIIVATAICACGSATAVVARDNRFTLPLPSRGKMVSVPIGQGIDLVAKPDQGDWIVQAVEAHDKGFPSNLFFPSAAWHGPIPSDVMAWQILKHYGYGNTRWVCVTGRPIVVELEIRDARVAPVNDGRIAVFTAGKLAIEWFHRPCKGIPGYG